MTNRNFSLKLAALAWLLAALYLAFGWLGASYLAETIPYPLLFSYYNTVIPLVVLIVLGVLITFIVLIYRFITRKRYSASEHPVRRAAGAFVMFLVAAFFALAALPPIVFGRAEHVRSLSFGGHVYQVAYWSVFDNIGRYNFYECDALGFICHKRHSESALSTNRNWVGTRETSTAIITDAEANTVSLQAFGETVFTLSPE